MHTKIKLISRNASTQQNIILYSKVVGESVNYTKGLLSFYVVNDFCNNQPFSATMHAIKKLILV